MANGIPQSWEYLETLPGTDFYRLYKHPSSALAIFRKRLTQLAKSFVMAMLYIKGPLLLSDLEIWVRPTSTSERETATELLKTYHIFVDASVGGARAYALTKDFAKSLRQALTGNGDPQAFGQVATDPSIKKIRVTDLDIFARQQWEGILGFMVGSATILEDDPSTKLKPPSAGVIELLKAGELISRTGTVSRAGRTSITKQGFAFVLQDLNTQVWTLLFLYVDNAEVFEMSKVAVLSFLFLISSLELGLPYSSTNLDPTQRRILQDLSDLGIVYQPLNSTGTAPAHYFYPTRLATTLTSEASTASNLASTTLADSTAPLKTPSNPGPPTSIANTAQGFLIIETNYRLYAYTSSPLQTALLSLFTNLKSRHPNLITGKISKASIQRAVATGITADQIISYLSSHAHPQMKRRAVLEAAKSSASGTGKSHSLLPATINDQIYLWQLEKDRMLTTEGALWRGFEDNKMYEAGWRYADEIGVLVWRKDSKRMFFVTRSEPVQSYLRSIKNG